MKSGLQSLATAITGTLLSFIAACGGGGGGGAPGTPPPAAFRITTTTLADGAVGVNYNQIVAVTGGTGAITFSISAGGLPAGLALNATTGSITGIPAAPAGTANITMMAADSGTPQQSDARLLTIDITDPLFISTSSLPSATIGVAYSQTITVTGGTTPHTFTIPVGSLPAGLSMSTGGVVTGVAMTAATNQTVTLRVRDSSVPQLIQNQDLTIPVTLEALGTGYPTSVVAGSSFGRHLEAIGGQPPYVWMRIAGTLPLGIPDPIPNTGFVGGTPAPVCSLVTSTFTVQVNDSATPPATDDQAGLSITVSPGSLMFVTSSLPNGIVGVPYRAIVQVAGGMPPYSFATNGTLPSMLGPIDPATGEIAGTPGTFETRTFQVIATDSCGTALLNAYRITINPNVQGRNDSIATAFPLGNGNFQASISPSGHPNTVLSPDQDYYRITTTTASTVSIYIVAQDQGSQLDSVIEIVEVNGVRLSSCVAPAFTSSCVHDDAVPGVRLDSRLEIRVGGATSFYLHVMDYRSDARPDFFYGINIGGVN